MQAGVTAFARVRAWNVLFYAYTAQATGQQFTLPDLMPSAPAMYANPTARMNKQRCSAIAVETGTRPQRSF